MVVEEEDTTREVRRLESTLSTAMMQIKVSIGNVCLCRQRLDLFIILLLLHGIARTTEQWRQQIKRMEPLAEENKKLKEAVKLMEKNI